MDRKKALEIIAGGLIFLGIAILVKDWPHINERFILFLFGSGIVSFIMAKINPKDFFRPDT